MASIGQLTLAEVFIDVKIIHSRVSPNPEKAQDTWILYPQ